ncbi:MAG: NAD(+) diphosphatase [Pseudomonadota bacterium]
MKDAESVTFGTSGLDRAAHLRADPPPGPVMPVWRGKPLVEAGETRRVVYLPPDHTVFDDASDAPIFLGLDDGQAVHARDVSAWEPDEIEDTFGAFFDPSEQHHPDLPEDQVFGDLRANMTLLDRRSAEVAATAKALIEWHRTHGFCARCGTRSVMAMSGWQRDCPACDRHHFPRTDPVVIMLITHGNSVLIGRSPGWPEGMYSLLAGFVEPGETLEAAVRREVVEESGVRVGEVTYLSSQPWPFPSSLMFGCRGDALTTDITLDPKELDDARWVSKEEMMEALRGAHPELKPARKGAIARFLIERWLADTLT